MGNLSNKGGDDGRRGGDVSIKLQNPGAAIIIETQVLNISIWKSQQEFWNHCGVILLSKPGKKLGIVGTIALHLPKVATCDDLLSYPIPRWSVDAGACQMGRTFNKVVQAKILCIATINSVDRKKDIQSVCANFDSFSREPLLEWEDLKNVYWRKIPIHSPKEIYRNAECEIKERGNRPN